MEIVDFRAQEQMIHKHAWKLPINFYIRYLEVLLYMTISGDIPNKDKLEAWNIILLTKLLYRKRVYT